MTIKTYRFVHFLWTGLLAFLISIPILERGGIDREVIDDSLFIGIWFVGVVLLFNKRFTKLGLILMLASLVFIVPVFFFWLC